MNVNPAASALRSAKPEPVSPEPAMCCKKGRGSFRVAFFAVVILAGIILLSGEVRHHQVEPRFAGRPLSSWLQQLDSIDSAERRAAERAIGTMGTNAVPHLVALIALPRSAAWGWARGFLTSLGFSPTEPVLRRAQAVRAFSSLGEWGAWAIPELAALLRKEETCTDAAHALAGLGPIALPTLLEASRNTNRWVRFRAAEALGTVGEGSEIAATRLAELQMDPDWRVRIEAAKAAGRTGQAASIWLPTLLTALSVKDDTIRYASASAIAALGQRARPALPALLTLLKTQAEAEREAIEFAITSIDPEALWRATELK